MRSAFAPRIIALLSLATLLSLYLLYHHLAITTGYQTGPSSCNFGGSFNCDTVALSSYSQVFGTPIAAWGLLFYLAFAAFILLQKKAGGENKAGGFSTADSAAVNLFLATVSLLPVFFLFYVSWKFIGTFCLFCSCLYVVHLFLFAITFFDPDREDNLLASMLKGASALFGGYFSSNTGYPKQIMLWVISLLAAALSFAVPSLAEEYFFKAQVAARAEESALISMIEQWRKGPKTESLKSIEVLTKGATEPKLTLVEFSDFECPHCRRASHMVSSLVKEFPEQLRFVFVNFPLDSACNPALERTIHANACEAARYTVCAAEQGKLWEMHDAIFAKNFLSQGALKSIVSSLELNEETFFECVRADSTKQQLEHGAKLATELNITSTPTFYLNGRKIKVRQLDTFKHLVRYMIEKNITE